jgi:hypothetical protein
MDIILVDKYQHQTAFLSKKPGIEIYTSSTSFLEKGSKSSSISLFFKTNQEQEFWYTMIVELWSGLSIAHEQCDTAVVNKASGHIVLMDILSNIDYQEETLAITNRQLTNPRLKSKQHHNEVIRPTFLKTTFSFSFLSFS